MTNEKWSDYKYFKTELYSVNPDISLYWHKLLINLILAIFCLIQSQLVGTILWPTMTS